MKKTALLAALLLSPLGNEALAAPALIRGQLSPSEQSIFNYFALNSRDSFLVAVLSQDKGKALADSLRASKAQPIMVLGDEAYLWAQQELADQPLIAIGISFDLARTKGRDKDRILLRDLPLSNKFQIVRQLFPQIKTVGLVYNPKEDQDNVARLIDRTRNEKLRLATVKIDSPDTLASQLPVFKGQIELFWLLDSPTLTAPAAQKTIASFCQENKTPLLASDPEQLKSGGAVAIRTSPEATGIFASRWVKEIAAGKSVPSIAFPEMAEISLSLGQTLPLAGSEKILIERLNALVGAGHRVELVK